MIRRVSMLLVLAVAVSVQAQEAEQGSPKLKLGPAVEPARQPASIEVERNKPVAKIAIPQGENLDVLWSDHFATRTEDPAAVRQAVRTLIEQSRFDHVVALINAALRHGQGQPWMHEALGLSMRALGAPQAEIERALLSAIDLQQPNPVNLMYAARYLAANGSPQRALDLYRQASDLVPNRPEPYEYGLQIAEQLRDLEGIKWATTGILSQAWNGEQTKLWQKAHNVAKANLDELRAARRLREADDFHVALKNALVRDVIAIVSWTGEADVDVAVEDPSGSVCTHRNPRTTGGGVLVKDTFARQGTASNKPISESYYCPKGFTGDYKLRLRRVWGKLTAGKVTVDLYTNWGTPYVKHMRKDVSVGDDDSMVVFNLKEGRRFEMLDDRLVENAAQKQNAVRRELLLQQLDSLADAAPVANLLRNREFAGTQFPLLNGGPNAGVGYQPVIIVLSEGASMSAQAVISADRRYVRFTGVPLFTGIGDVTTFNIQSGAQTRDQFQGGGAQGGGGVGGGGDPFGGGGAGGNNNPGGLVCNVPDGSVVNNRPVMDLPDPGAVQFAYVIPPSNVNQIDGPNRLRQEANKCTAAGLGPTLRFDTYPLTLGGLFFNELYLLNGGQPNLPQNQIALPEDITYRVPPGMRIVEHIGGGALRLIQGYDPADPQGPGAQGCCVGCLGICQGTQGMTFPNGGTVTIYD